MAYTTGSATDLGDLLTKLDAFLTGTPSSTVLGGYTQDDFDDGATTAAEGFALWHKSNLYVGVKWIANAPNNMSIHQALGYTSGYPGVQTDDSNNGYNSAFGSDAQLDDGRCVNDIGDGPFVSYHFFGDATLDYCHVVVEIESEVFRHFGFGNLEKFNDWTGGEYCYGHFQEESATSAEGTDTGHWLFFDGIQASTSSTTRRNATIHAEGLPHQGGSEKWLHHSGGITTDPVADSDFLDRAGQPKRITYGGFRGGPVAYPWSQTRSDITTGHIPMYPLAIFTRDFTNSYVYYLGNVPDIRGVDILNFSPGQEVTIGSDVWIIFPSSRRTEDSIINRSFYQGVAYRKVT